MTKPLPCPFCGADPEVEPKDPHTLGHCWALVECVNPECKVKPKVRDNVGVSDNRGSNAYKLAAILIWNTRVGFLNA